MPRKKKIIRISTVPVSLNIFCRGLLAELSGEYEVVAVTSPGEGFGEISRREGVRTVAVGMSRHISPLRDVWSLLRLICLFLRERPRMVHSITPKAGLLSMMAAWVARVPVRVHTFTGLLFPTATGLRRRVLMLADRLTCACATHIVPEGEGVRNDLLCHGITDKPLRVLGHGNVRGIDLRHYSPTPGVVRAAAGIRASLGIAPDAFVFVFAGRMVADKGIAELVSAFLRLSTRSAGVHLLLVGGEEPSSPLASAVSGMIASSANIHRAGWRDDLRPWYAAADALVLPSYREGFPNVVIEAGAMGLPCIVTDINGSREIIRQGENGVIVPPCDEDALYAAMAAFAGDPCMVKALSANARRLVASRYEQGYVRKCLKDFYHGILE